CASGTGEFFLQQIKRMDLDIDDATQVSENSEPFKVSGRCSVFCKSDCTHALNKGVTQGEVTAGLAQMMSEKVEELLQKTRPGKVLVIGGVSRNTTVMNFLKDKVGDIDISEYSTCFEALGAAIYGLDNEVKTLGDGEDIFVYNESSFVFHKPLENFKDMVRFESTSKAQAADGDICILGLDVGSTTTKAVIMRQSDDKVLGSVYLYTHGNPVTASKKCYSELLRQIPEEIKIVGIGVTGSGRQISGLHALTDGVVNEIIAHAAAAVYYDPEVDTIFEIGGQDAKYTYIVNRVPADYAMNEACSAGTGSFIEESAYESLGIEVQDIEPIAMKGMNPPNFSDQCAAFIGSDIKTAQQENISKENIVAGLVYSICLNYVNRVKGNRQIGKKVFMQGGVCYNKAIPTAMAALTGKEIIVPPDPGMTGAFGVALVIKEKIEAGLMPPLDYKLEDLSQRDVAYKAPFTCAGGKEKCDRKCEINRILIEDKTYPFGGACNMYYNLRANKNDFNTDDFDFVKKRQYLTFDKFTPEQTLPTHAKTVGINLSYHTHTLYPLYYHFFDKLGFKIILSDTVEPEGLEREQSSLCFPGQLSLGLFQDLLNMKPDYYFVPEILEMYTEDADHNRLDFNCTCAFLNAEPLILKQAFKDYDLKDKFIMPIFNFADGFHVQEKQFIESAQKMGVIDVNAIKEAHSHAVAMQAEYQESLYALGREFMTMLESDPEATAIVLVGRPYNSFTDTANKGIPRKFASRAVYIVPYDIFDYRNELIEDDQYWESAKKILKISKFIKRHPQLFATYLTNYSCAPDSMTLTTFRSLMGSKPSLSLELDGLTADAG
ncbi:MAG: acyl-CoA dehydratase activase, partial [Candidatus Kapabacteria bacterium]|nr:acyl-CoA dehydratase activase [Candidatus Kapabacteria bacterium]